jgi:alkaline phosphatase D
MSRMLSALAAGVLLTLPALASADSAACTKAIGRETGKYLKSRLKTITKCNDRRSAGKLPANTICRPQCDAASAEPGTPCRTNADCPGGTCLAVSDTSTSTKLGKAAMKASMKITSGCAGVVPLPPVGPACDGSAGTPAALATCITDAQQDPDVQLINADTLARTVYSEAAKCDLTVMPTPKCSAGRVGITCATDADCRTAPIADAALQKCQAGIGKEVGKYAAARYKSLQKCNEKLAKGAIAGPCPDASTVAAIEKKRAKLDLGIRKKCTEAQVAATTEPKLYLGFPCEQFLNVTFKRDGMTNNNAFPVLDRLINCLTDTTAAMSDRMLGIGYPGVESSAFTSGVAAGDATDTAAIFWTRLPDSSMGAFLDVSTDSTFTSGVQTIAVPAPALGDDGTVKVEVTLLTPYTNYYYRFRQGGDTSPTGRVKTTPAPATTQSFRVGWTGDANAFFRPYTVLDPIRLADTDAWFFIGDTIYGDDPRSGTGVAVGTDDYYTKYKENRADRPLRQMMESTGTYVMWDDHEVRNDFSGAVAAFATKKANGNYAFRKYNPIREDMGDPTQLYRSFKFGTLAEFFIIDLRSYRSAKYTCCNNGAESGFVLTDDDTTCTTSGDLALPDAACTTALNTPGRTVLGATQLAWLENGLLNSTATFKFIMNGPPITNLFFQPYDFWIGYPEERDALLGFILDPNGDMDQSDRIQNVVWLSTDLHGIVISHDRVSIGLSQPVPEVVGGAIGMDPIFRELPASLSGLLTALPGLLTQITQFDIDRFNAAVVTVTDTPAPTATIEFYDRSNTVIQTVSFP